MSLLRQNMESALKDLGITVQTDGVHFVHTAPWRYASVINSVITLDEDGSGATLMAILPDSVPTEKRSSICELLNLVHGQNLWNVRFHLDDEGRVFSVGKFSLWGKPFNAVQLGDIFFSLLVTTDRLSPCLTALLTEGLKVEETFSRFFLKKTESD